MNDEGVAVTIDPDYSTFNDVPTSLGLDPVTIGIAGVAIVGIILIIVLIIKRRKPS